MGLVGWIVIGLVAGSIAQSIAGVEKRGCLFTLLVGVVGAFVVSLGLRAIGAGRR